MIEGSARYDLMNSIPHIDIFGRRSLRPAVMTAGKTWHPLSGYFNGRR
jgi:gamma-glutamylputrescine oxidase